MANIHLPNELKRWRVLGKSLESWGWLETALLWIGRGWGEYEIGRKKQKSIRRNDTWQSNILEILLGDARWFLLLIGQISQQLAGPVKFPNAFSSLKNGIQGNLNIYSTMTWFLYVSCCITAKMAHTSKILNSARILENEVISISFITCVCTYINKKFRNSIPFL